MRFFTLQDNKPSEGIDVSQYTVCSDLIGKHKIKAGSFRLFSPGYWSIDKLINQIKEKEPFDILLYCDARLSAVDSVTSLLPKDCFLLEVHMPDVKFLRDYGDKSMPLLQSKLKALFICYEGTTIIQLKDDEFLTNMKGKPTIVKNVQAMRKKHLAQIEQSEQDGFIIEF